MADNVMIYATGSDGDMRQVCFGLLAQKLAMTVDRLDKGSLEIDDKGREKLRSSGICMVITADKQHAPAILDRLRRVDGARGYVLPILDSF